eukprot:3934968-Rhodomonas_salina.3
MAARRPVLGNNPARVADPPMATAEDSSRQDAPAQPEQGAASHLGPYNLRGLLSELESVLQVRSAITCRVRRAARLEKLGREGHQSNIVVTAPISVDLLERCDASIKLAIDWSVDVRCFTSAVSGGAWAHESDGPCACCTAAESSWAAGITSASSCGRSFRGTRRRSQRPCASVRSGGTTPNRTCRPREIQRSQGRAGGAAARWILNMKSWWWWEECATACGQTQTRSARSKSPTTRELATQSCPGRVDVRCGRGELSVAGLHDVRLQVLKDSYFSRGHHAQYGLQADIQKRSAHVFPRLVSPHLSPRDGAGKLILFSPSSR